MPSAQTTLQIAATLDQTSTAVRGRIPELDGVRGIAILSVFAAHFLPRTGPLAIAGQATRVGWAGVDLFFVLSGFLITGILLDTKGAPHYYRNFLVRRTLRIFPLYFAALALYLAIGWAKGMALGGWGIIGPYLAYVGNIANVIRGNDAAHQPGFLLHLWSLHIEEQFYLLYPLLVAVVSTRRLRSVLIGCVVAAPVLRSAISWSMGGPGWQPCYVLMPCRMDALALGGLVAIGMRAGSISKRAAWTTLLAGAAAMFVLFALRGPAYTDPVTRSVGYTLVGITSAAFVATALHERRGALGTALRTRPLVYIGQLAYGLYLLQRVPEVIDHRLSDNSIPHVLITLTLIFALAALSWRFFEQPILRLRERFER